MSDRSAPIPGGYLFAPRDGWADPEVAAEAEEIVAQADEHVARIVGLAEKGARTEVDRVLRLCGDALRDGVCLDLIAEALDETAIETRKLAKLAARARAAVEGVEL